MKLNLNSLKFILFIIVLGMLIGCSNQENNKASETKQDLTKQGLYDYPVDQSAAKKAQDQVLKTREVIAARGVTDGKNLVIAVRVKHFDRFRLKDIEKKLKTQLKKSFKDQSVELSTDQKIYWELDKLKGDLKKQEISQKELTKRLDKIKNLMKAQT